MVSGSTATMTGTGAWNDRAGFSFTAVALDGGRRTSDYGEHRRLTRAFTDRFEITIRNASGAVVFVITGPVTRGDIVVSARSGYGEHGGARRPARR